jgi:hypothetical protein
MQGKGLGVQDGKASCGAPVSGWPVIGRGKEAQSEGEGRQRFCLWDGDLSSAIVVKYIVAADKIN